jgi:5-methylcytosine-specific restriction endonuclease McrA
VCISAGQGMAVEQRSRLLYVAPDRLTLMDRSLTRWMTPRERRLYRASIEQVTPVSQRARRAAAWRAYLDQERTAIKQADIEWRRIVRKMTHPLKRPGVSRFVPYLMERDAARCGICHRLITQNAGPMRPSVDHIVPWSMWRAEDGPDPDCLENLQLAHLRCNISKGNRVAGQILLIG